jgi:hypothetical protein
MTYFQQLRRKKLIRAFIDGLITFRELEHLLATGGYIKS